MVSRDDVVHAYRYLLGREPENAAAIDAHLDVEDVSTLRTRFMASSEFLDGFLHVQRPPESFFPSQTLPALRIDSEGTPKQLASLLERIRNEWEEFGRTEPHWSVLTHDTYKQQALETNRSEFFQSGAFVTQIIDAFMKRHGLSLPPKAKCLELGCGVGRITMHLAKMFHSVVGVDISKFHLQICEAELKQENIGNVSLVCLDKPQTLLDLPPFDFFCSFIVLQHNPPPAMTFLLDTILGKLTPGGMAIFQLPTYRVGYRYDLKEYLAHPRPLHMEMHVLPQSQVFAILKRNGCRLVELREDGWAEGRNASSISNTFYAVKE